MPTWPNISSPPPDPAITIRAALDRLAGDLPALGVAVSGGGDSMALLHVIAAWAAGRRVMVASVDHGLRAASRAEAARVAQEARALGLPHDILTWQRPPGPGNLMAQARHARLALLSDWARAHDLPAIALGHTADDQAETLMMRLARGAGIDGLAAMAERRHAHGVAWLRPMLTTRRQELRDWLRQRDIAWIDDPSNDSPEFERIRLRRSIAATGLDVGALADSAAHLAEARDALVHYTLQIAQQAQIRNGSLSLPRGAFLAAPREIRRRLLSAACRWITGAPYPPRRATMQNALNSQAAFTLDGALVTPGSRRIHIIREPAAALREGASAGPVWDDRWRVDGLEPGQSIVALGFQALPELDWRGAGLTRNEAAASPAIRESGRLLAAPLLEPHPKLKISPLRSASDLISLIMMH